MNKGQISVSWLIGIGVSVAVAAFGTINVTNNRTDEKVGVVQHQASMISERTAKLETSIPAIQEDIKEIKESLKGIEKALRIVK